jgi:hypothetical protein
MSLPLNFQNIFFNNIISAKGGPLKIFNAGLFWSDTNYLFDFNNFFLKIYMHAIIRVQQCNYQG